MSAERGGRPSGVQPTAACVIVAEDEPDLREAIVELVVDAGYTAVHEVSTVRDLRAAIAEKNPVAITLDLNLADDSSETILDELTARAPPIAIVLVTASVDAPAIAERYGVELVVKPFELDTLLEALARAMQRVTAA